jgi:hypothetical protein
VAILICHRDTETQNVHNYFFNKIQSEALPKIRTEEYFGKLCRGKEIQAYKMLRISFSLLFLRATNTLQKILVYLFPFYQPTGNKQKEAFIFIGLIVNMYEQ